MNVERLFFFFDKFSLDVGAVLLDSRMIIINVRAWNLGSWSRKSPTERNSFRVDPECSWIVWNRVIWRERTSFGLDQGLEIR
jgi:hypothetical protein